MRAVARLAGADAAIYGGGDAYAAARIDGFLDASLVFARDSQIYLLSFRADGPTAAIHESAARAFATWMTGIERALATGGGHIAGPDLTPRRHLLRLRTRAVFAREGAGRRVAKSGLAPIVTGSLADDYPRAVEHFAALRAHPAFAPDLGPYLEKIEADAASG